MTRIERIAFNQSIGFSAEKFIAMTDDEYEAAAELAEYRAEYRDWFKPARLQMHITTGGRC